MYDMQNMYYNLIMKNKKTVPKQSILWQYKSYNTYVMYDLQLTYRKTGMRGIVR